MYGDILLPFDGSGAAAAALHHAAEIAHWTDGSIQLLFIADTARDSVTVVESDVVDALVQEGEQILDDAAEALRTLGVDHDSEVVQGNPAPTIAEYAERYDYDVIVMPTHGRTRLSRYLLGSVTEKVVRLSSVPVLTVRMRDDEQLGFPYKDILLPTDGSAGALTAAEHGLSLAESLDATVHVLSVVNDLSLGIDVRSGVFREAREQAAAEAVDEVVSVAEARGIQNTVRHIEHGSPSDAIRQTVDSEAIDAVVMGTTGRSGTERILLGSVAEKTVREAPVPVITVRHDA